MLKAKQVFVGIGVTAVASALISFSNGEDTGKKKKYHIIHQKDGVMHEYDTLLPMNSTYTVENYLMEKGISAEGVRIIEMPSEGHGKVMIQSGDGSERIMMHRMDRDIMISDEEGDHKEVKIIRTDDGNGNVVTKKFVNGKEVELTDEERARIAQRQNERSHNRHIVIEEHANKGKKRTSKSEDQQVELKVEMDEEGNMTVQKFINGEEVEVSPEELENIQKRHEARGERGRVVIEEDMDGTHGEMIVEIEMIEGEMDSLLNEIELEESIDGEGTRVIIKEIHMEDEERESGTNEVKREMRLHKTVDVDSEGEDFTVVIVSKEIDENSTTRTQVNRMQMNAPISVYPNPNNGTFTIAFQQVERAKTSVEVLDVQGKVIFKEKLGSFSGEYKKELDLKSHGAGLYLVKVQQGDEMSSLKVVVE